MWRLQLPGFKSDSTGQDSICYSLYQYGQKVARGEIIDPAFFMAWWEAPQDGDHRDLENWKKANPGFDDIVSAEDFVSAVARTPEAEFRTKRLNQWVSSQTAWLPNGSWDSLAVEYELQPEDEYVLGFDGSFSGDTTVVVGCCNTVGLQPTTTLGACGFCAWFYGDVQASRMFI